MSLVIHLPEEIINLLLHVGSRKLTAGRRRPFWFRPEIPFRDAGTNQTRPDRDHDQPETERAPFPTNKPTEQEFQPERQRHALRAYQMEARYA